MVAARSKILLALMAGWLIFQPGCSRAPNRGAGAPTPPAARQVLSAQGAADQAAKLANDQCEHDYRRRPFTADQYPAVLEEGVYHWGKMDVGGRGGFSTVVTFGPDGSEPHVEVFFSTDALT
jgi:hypothetical protein